jgi:hypothetical protein
MKEVVFESEKYKEFENSDEGNAWGWMHFSDVLTPEDNSAYESVLFYTGSMSRKWNKVLRRYPSIESGQFESSARGEFAEDGEQIRRIKEVNSVVTQHRIPENIIVYRYTNKKLIRKLCSAWILKRGMRFTDKGFFSTTLVSHLLMDFANKHECDCLLKIYIPKGTKGAYVSIKNSPSILNEQEVLFAPNLKLEIVKVNYLTHPFSIECKII